MPLVYRMTPYWKCALCGAERPVRNLEKPPRQCNSCCSCDWFAGDRTGKQIKAKRVRNIGGRPLQVRESSEMVLRQIYAVEADLRIRGEKPRTEPL